MRAGDLLADRYRLDDLLSESGEGRFWHARDLVLGRPVAVHLVAVGDTRADRLLEAARHSAAVLDQRILRVLDADRQDGVCYVVNEWGSGASLDIMLANHGPLSPRPAAWVVSEVASAIATAHEAGVTHGRLVPENVLVDNAGCVRVIGLCVEAAMHGLPDADPDTDLQDLAGLLHAALTGTWAGPSTSAVPRTPTEHGRPLRPRQVRAGVPRPLDDLVDELVGSRKPHGAQPVDSARLLAAALADFVGDPSGLGEAIAAGTAAAPPRPTRWTAASLRLRDTEETPLTDEAGTVEERHTAPSPEEPETRERVQPAVRARSAADRPSRLDQPTEAGLPIFDDATDDVSWLARRTDPVPPPPPFEDPPERPLFAPDPPGGRAPRRDAAPAPAPSAVARAAVAGRLPAAGAPAPEYWPWIDDSNSTGSGRIPPYQDESAGRNWLRLAAMVAVVLVLVVAVAIAYNIGRGRSPLGAVPEPSESPSVSSAPRPPYRNLTVTDFDPQGTDGGVENSQDTPATVDGDPETAWTTASYNQQLGPLGLKTGVGLLIDLGAARPVSRLDVTLGAGASTMSVYVAGQEPTTVDGLQAVDQLTGSGRQRLVLDEPVEGQYVVLWFTALAPTEDGRFRGEVAEISVRG